MATLIPAGQTVKPDGVTNVSQGIYTYADGSGTGLDTKEVVATVPVVAALAPTSHRAGMTATDADPFTTPGSGFTPITVAPHQTTITALFDWNAGAVNTTATPALAYSDGTHWFITESATAITTGTATHVYRLRSFGVVPGIWAIVIPAMDAGVSPTLSIAVIVS